MSYRHFTVYSISSIFFLLNSINIHNREQSCQFLYSYKGMSKIEYIIVISDNKRITCNMLIKIRFFKLIEVRCLVTSGILFEVCRYIKCSFRGCLINVFVKAHFWNISKRFIVKFMKNKLAYIWIAAKKSTNETILCRQAKGMKVYL